jgi:hypothetical protein
MVFPPPWMSIDPARYRLPEDLKTNRCDLGATRGSAFAWLVHEGPVHPVGVQ